MHDFPLLSFLLSLESDGLFLAVRDYDRIAHVLGMGGEWTLGRLKHVLLALLAKDVEQQELLLRRFDDTFDADLPALAAGWDAKLDIQKVRADLASLPKPSTEQDFKRSPIRQYPQAKPSLWARFMDGVRAGQWLKLSLLSLLLFGILLVLARDSIILEPPARLQIDPPLINLTAEPGKDHTIELSLVNLGGGEVKPGVISLEGEGFSLKSHGCGGQSLSNGQRCGISLGFRHDQAREFTAKLKARSDQGEAEAQITAQNQPHIVPPNAHQDELSQLPVVIHQPRQPYIKSIEEIPNPDQEAWKLPAVVAALLLVLNLAFAVYLRRYQQLPIDQPPPWNADKPRHFPFERVGGMPAPRLDRQTLAYLADCMGYFHSDSASHRPDIRASVLATVRHGGIPSLRFFQRKQLRQLLILQDGHAGDIARRNPIAHELAEGLERLGVEVLAGQFYDDPATGWDEQGRAFYLDDLENRRNGLLLLLVGEAGRVRDEARLSLERLARWPHRAWMDLTPAETRDAHLSLPERCGMPVYPATAEGLTAAFEHFLSETGGRFDPFIPSPHGGGLRSNAVELSKSVPSPTGGGLGWGQVKSVASLLSDRPPPSLPPVGGGVNSTALPFVGAAPEGTHSVPYDLELRLGDALPWAAACAMLQPFSFGLADSVRRQFFSHLPAERIERLVALPGTLATAEGLRFNDETVQTLQGLFIKRLPEAVQRAIAGFLLQVLNEAWAEQAAAEPPLQASPARLAWERRYEQIRVWLEPDEALKRLSELSGTPLGAVIRLDFKCLGKHLPVPEDPISRQRFARLVPDRQIPLLERFRLRPWQKALAGLLVFGFIGSAGFGAYQAWLAYDTGVTLVVRAEAEIGAKVRLINLNEPTPKLSLAFIKEAEASLLRGLKESINPNPIQEFPRLPVAARIPVAQSWRLELPEAEHQSFDLGMLTHDTRITLGFKPIQPTPPANSLLIVTDLQGHPVKEAQVHLRTAGDAQTHPTASQIRLPAGDYEIKLVSADGFESSWQKLSLKPDERLVKPLAYDRVFRDKLKDGGYGPQLVSLPGGTFKMGENGVSGPVHEVSLSPYAIGTHEVTFAEYDRFAEATGQVEPIDTGRRGDRPVMTASWDDATAYAAWLTQQTGKEYRLPTEAQWEFAAKAGSDTAYWWGDAYADNLANCRGNKTTPVGLYPANAFGLYDTAGNVWEWVSDWDGDAAADQPARDPQGPAQGSYRVIRGGSWSNGAVKCRSAIRFRSVPSIRYATFNHGFRLARTDPKPSYPVTLAPAAQPKPDESIQPNMPAPFSELRDKLKDGSAGPAMVVLPGGSFKMGSPYTEKGHRTDEDPVHEVKLTAFALGRTEVTVGDYLRFVNATKTHYPEWLEPGNSFNIQTGSDSYYKKFGEALQAADHPIIGISWDDANAYAQWLSQQTGQTYRLPSEAQWEYAARSGSDKAYAFGDDPAKLGDYAWYAGNAEGKPHKVGDRPTNAFGLHDMHGNVWEWTGDWFGNYPKSSNSTEQDPIGPATGSRRVVRGGSWGYDAVDCRSAVRLRNVPSSRLSFLGFRLSRTLP